MFLKRMFASVRKSLFRRKPAELEPGAEGRMLVQRVRELMQLIPTVTVPAADIAGTEVRAETTEM